MALYTTKAIILGAVNWGEADRIVTFFSRERGKIKAAAYGCRRPRSRLATISQIFSIVDVQLSSGQRLDIVRNCEHNGFLADFSLDYTAFAYASFIAEFVTEVFEEGQVQTEVYDKLIQIIPAMVKRNPRIVALAGFLQLLEYTGYQLHYDKCVVCGTDIQDDAFFSYEQGGVICNECHNDKHIILAENVRRLILHLKVLQWDKLQSFNIQGKDLLAAEAIMLNYIEFILDKRLKSLDFINQIIK
ncbi:DNA repair protein RecO [Pectinatus brassicae]|uniref:DNA repair protein RecO n=1 Tax=Pectinatus brassicae TaxID=862415 RepID=A0A840UH61_9FIRM|nr:DNA repair protein RecO [Pectinatus brassicae]MBB5337081.1 DNA repair protein RecO (recombination protein O) [Pectinatus brassicae]